MRRQYAELLAPKGRLKLHHISEFFGPRQALGQAEARLDVAPGDVDDLAIEGDSTLAGDLERPLERRLGRIESIQRTVTGFAGLQYGLLGKIPHALRHGGVETEIAELVCRPAVGQCGPGRRQLWDYG